jgi:hypothetical protein
LKSKIRSTEAGDMDAWMSSFIQNDTPPLPGSFTREKGTIPTYNSADRIEALLQEEASWGPLAPLPIPPPHQYTMQEVPWGSLDIPRWPGGKQCEVCDRWIQATLAWLPDEYITLGKFIVWFACAMQFLIGD